jgi:hypothetical protein
MCAVDLLTESERQMRADGALLLSGKFQSCGIKNQNNRVYPKHVLEREVQSYQRLISENRALGELDHPDSSIVSLERASHAIIRLWWKENDLFGVIRVLSTPMGNILRSFVNDGISVGISSRALGNVTESRDGSMLVSDDLSLLTFDAVCDPSVPGAFLQLREVRDPDTVTSVSKADRINRLLNRILK